MKNFTLYFIALCFFALSCKKDNKSNNSDCVNQFIASNGLTPYTGQVLDCESRAGHYKLDGIEYFHLDDPCADYFPDHPYVNCNGDFYCDPNDLTAMQFFANNAEYLGIIGFK
jgi:hypothetical protein